MSESYLIRLPPITIPLATLLTSDQKDRRGRLDLSFDLLGILDPERMKEILGEVLTALGWATTDGAWACRSPNRGIWRLDPDARILGIDITDRLAVNLSLDPSTLGIFVNRSSDLLDPTHPLSHKQRAVIEEALDHHEAGVKDTLVREALQAQQALNEALQQVYRRALREKAEKMGNVVSISESEQDGTTRIRIEIA